MSVSVYLFICVSTCFSYFLNDSIPPVFGCQHRTIIYFDVSQYKGTNPDWSHCWLEKNTGIIAASLQRLIFVYMNN